MLCLALVSSASADETALDNAAQRWSQAGPGGTPEFSRHVLPLVGKLGCNNRACHGSFQGQNGFRLSLFGSDPAADHQALVEDQSGEGPRFNVKSPEKSLALLKPSEQVDHGGGQRMKAGSWPYRMLLSWIRAGAPFDAKQDSTINDLEISPREIVVGTGQAKVPIRLVARFSDGSSEDVTCLTTFESKDDGTAKVSEDGHVSAVRPGDTAIIASFGGEVRSCQVLVPRGDEATPRPKFTPNNEIDVLVGEKLEKLRVRPAELASDQVFLRRASLDVAGTLPSPDQVRRFLADQRPDRRGRLIEELLSRENYAKYWATIFSDITGNQGINPHPQVSHLWQSWLEEKLRRNWSYDRIVGGILTATSLEGRQRKELLAEIAVVRESIQANPKDPARWTSRYDHGTYAQRDTLDLFWLRIPNRQPDRVALQTSVAFLGVRLDCAQCHKHPYDRWTQKDFEQFQSFFRVMDYRYAPTGGPLPRKGRIAYGRDELVVGLRDRYKRQVQQHVPKLLGGKEIPYEPGGRDPRIALFEWMRSPQNPYFAPNIVNRVWAHYFGVGLVEPLEDFSQGNPPSNPPLLKWLADDFIRHGFNLKHLHRRILNSRTYQLSFVPNDSNRFDRRNYSRALFRRMPAEVLVHALATATGVPYRFNYTPREATPLEYAPTLRMPYPLELFGRGIRKQTCGNCERTSEPALNQALYLLTDNDIMQRVQAGRGRLRELKPIQDDRKIVEELYLSTLSRFPKETELGASLRYRDECESREEWMEDVLWSLLNVREFIFQH